MFAALMTLAACEKVMLSEDGEVINEKVDGKTKKFTFTMKGEFQNPTFTRGYLANDNTLTDLWAFDYMDGACIQQLHQTPTDEAWGQPAMKLRYGLHHIYFVASRGDTPTLNEAEHTISWDLTRDTYWKDYEVEVVSTSNGNRAVTLDRVATKLKISITDEVPEDLASLIITPSVWYYGLDYTTGTATNPERRERPISVPSSYVGTTGQLVASIFGISNATEWTTDVDIEAKDANGSTIGSAEIKNAPFIRNRATEYSGRLFQVGEGFTINISDSWDDPLTGVW